MENLELNPHEYAQLIIDKSANAIHGEKMAFS